MGRRVFAATDRLASFPKLGRPIPELPHRSYRKWWAKPCWIYYRVDGSRSLILHVRRGEQYFRVEELLGEQ